MTTETTSQTNQVGVELPPAGTYVVDPNHSTIGFVARHLLATKVRGSFTEFEGTVVIGDSPETSSVTASAKAESIFTNQPQRDEHLRSGDFLEASSHPLLTLRSTKVQPASKGHYQLVAELTVRGVTKEVTFDLEFLGHGPGMQPGTTVLGFEATASIDRQDFGVSFNRALETGGWLVANRVDLELSIQAVSAS